MAAWPSQSLAGSLHVEVWNRWCVCGGVPRARAESDPPRVVCVAKFTPKKKTKDRWNWGSCVCTSNRTAGAVSGSDVAVPVQLMVRWQTCASAAALINRSTAASARIFRSGIGEFGELGSGSCSFRDAILLRCRAKRRPALGKGL